MADEVSKRGRVMRLPLRLDRGLLTIVDADNETVCSAIIVDVDRIDAKSAENLQRLVDSANALRLLIPEARQHFAENPLQLAMNLTEVALQAIRDEAEADPQTHFGPGPLGLVKRIS